MKYTFSDWQSGAKPPKGWDAADAVADGWSKSDIEAFMRATVRPWEPSAPAEIEETEPPAEPVSNITVLPLKTRREQRQTGQTAPAEVVPIRSHDIELQTNPKGVPVANLANARCLLTNSPSLRGVFAFDEMSRSIIATRQIPGFRAGAPGAHALTDEDADAAQDWIQRLGDIPNMGRDAVRQAIGIVARENAFHPVRDNLNTLQWDGAPRLSGLLNIYFGAEQTDYTGSIGTMFLIAMVARIFRPGCKMDYMLILEGGQGAEKSSACRALAGAWFGENLPDVSSGKEASQYLRGKWLIEVAELSAMRKADAVRLKDFLTRQTEQYRPAYGRYEVSEDRQCAFVGTTNEEAYLSDHTGNRRFWPVKIGRIDVAAIKRDRDQILAEAVQRFRDGERWWPDRDFEAAHIAPEQAQRRDDDAWEQPIGEYLDGLASGRTSIGQVAADALKIEKGKLGRAEQNRIAAIMTIIGWKRAPRTGAGRFWIGPAAPEAGDVEF